MKYLYFLSTLLFFIACNEKSITTNNSVTSNKQSQRKLQKTDLPIEVVAANVAFLPKLFRAENTVKFKYELNISNNYRVPFILKKVEIFNLEDDSVPLAQFDSDYIDENFERPGFRDEDDVKLVSANQFGVLHLDITFNNKQKIPEKIYHKLYFERQNKKGEINTYPMEVAIITVPSITDNTLGFPFKQKGKWLYEADGHKGAQFITEGKSTYPQRFAIDWTFVNEDGSFAKNDISKNKNWKTYGIELIAVANGTVVGVKDGIKENVPLSEEMAVDITLETITGNYVILDIGNETYALYGHLIPGSLIVKVGETVEKGQVLGLLGNSGNSDAAHLHFQLETKSNAFFKGEGLPYQLEKFTQLDYYDSAEEVLELLKNNQVPIDSLNPIKKFNQLPVGYGLIEVE